VSERKRAAAEASLYPLFLKLNGAPALVVGAGRVARRKIEALLECGAQVTVVAPEAEAEIAMWAEARRVAWHKRPFTPGDATGQRLAIAATSDRAVNAAVAEAARTQGALVNAVDMPDLCDFYVPAVVRRPPLLVAVSTAGNAPALARRVREELEARFPADIGAFFADVGTQRETIKLRAPGKVALWGERIAACGAFEAALAGRTEEARRLVEAATREFIDTEDEQP